MHDKIELNISLYHFGGCQPASSLVYSRYPTFTKDPEDLLRVSYRLYRYSDKDFEFT